MVSQLVAATPFKATPEPQLRITDEPGDTHVYPPNVELFCQGDDALEVYFIRSGFLKLFRAEGNGRRILLDLRFPGSLVGSAAAIMNVPHPITVVTGTSCELNRWRAKEFAARVASDGSLSFRVLEMLSSDVFDHIARISQLTCLPARQRLEQLLSQFCERLRRDDAHQRPERATKLQLPLKQYEIAELLSITPTYLCRLLNALETDQILSRRRGWIVVREPSRLCQLEVR